MKYLLPLALGVAAANAQQPANSQKPYYDIGNIISRLEATQESLTKNVLDDPPAPKSAPKSGKSGNFGGFGGLMGRVISEVKLHSRVEIPSQKKLRPNSIRAKAAFGPYTLVGNNQTRPRGEMFSLDPKGQSRVAILPKGSFCAGKDCTILSARIGMTYEDGSEATPDTGVYVHHILSFVPGRPATNAIGVCDVADPDNDTNTANNFMRNKIPVAPFTGRGEDGGPVSMRFTSDDGKFDSGFHLGKNDVIAVQSDLVNYKNTTQNVYLTYEYEYVDGFQGVQAITTMLSVTGCLYVIPPKVNMTGTATTVSKKFPITNDATLLNLRGHMHDGGDKMILSVNDKPVCESLAEYKDKTLWSMTSCGKPIDVKKGDYITLTSIYDAVKHPLRPSTTDSHSHAKNMLGLNDLMGYYAVTFATKPKN